MVSADMVSASMDSAGFDPASWGHWLLIASFFSLSIAGLALSWQWRKEARTHRKRARLSRHLAMELHDTRAPSMKASYVPMGETSRVSFDAAVSSSQNSHRYAKQPTGRSVSTQAISTQAISTQAKNVSRQ